jgi:hypothetical protein
MIRFTWTRQDGGFRATLPDNVTLVVTPAHYARHSLKPARFTKWHAQCTHWDERTRTATRFGRDVYSDLQPTARDARKLAEAVYLEEIASRTVNNR